MEEKKKKNKDKIVQLERKRERDGGRKRKYVEGGEGETYQLKFQLKIWRINFGDGRREIFGGSKKTKVRKKT